MFMFYEKRWYVYVRLFCKGSTFNYFCINVIMDWVNYREREEIVVELYLKGFIFEVIRILIIVRVEKG